MTDISDIRARAEDLRAQGTLTPAQSAYACGFAIWCRWGERDDCGDEHERRGFDSAAYYNEQGGGDRPVVSWAFDWAIEYDPTAPGLHVP